MAAAYTAASLYGTTPPVANVPAAGTAPVPDQTGMARPATPGSLGQPRAGFWHNPTAALVGLIALAFLLSKIAFGFSFKVTK